MSNAVYEKITNQIIAALEQGAPPWRKPWDSTLTLPRNAVSNRAYTGVNVLTLWTTNYEDNRWLTFNQARQLNGTVKKGEKATTITFYKTLERKADPDDEETKRYGLLRYYHVFNVLQCEGLALPAKNIITPILGAESIVANMPNRPRITHDGGDRAYHRPSTDTIHLPPRDSFESAGEWYSTVFHELTHSTGHKSRLDRHDLETGASHFQGDNYSREELIAEVGNSYLCAQAGISNTLANSTAYLAGWIKVLKGDTRLIVTAASAAQKAADYILAE